ncbi:MAG: hypothetical protein IPN17_27040 [Deltaproteobacteria bacterium]|nr:hypothetical protein [Deltaproteobacteria bacterium]
MTTLRRLPLLLALSLLAPACASFHVNTPNGFAELEDDSRYDYRATNADGVVIAVRVMRNEPEASLEFWGGWWTSGCDARATPLRETPSPCAAPTGWRG